MKTHITHQKSNLVLTIGSGKSSQSVLIQIRGGFDEHHFREAKQNIPCSRIAEKVFTK